MLTYNNDPELKAKLIKQLQDHYDADEIIKGQYWENGKGCAVGCTLHSSNHEEGEKKLGWPAWLLHLEDKLFEGMSNDKAKEFPLDIAKSIGVGKTFQELNKIKWKFCAYLLNENIKTVLLLENISEELKKEVIDAIRGCLKLHEDAIKNGEMAARSAAWSAESAARSAAWSAAWSAESAADSAAWSAARSAAWSAESAAESAARSAAWSAESAARSAAWSAE